MKSLALLSTIKMVVFREGPAQAIIIQLGENDLTGEKGKVLSWTIIVGLQTLHQELPDHVVLVQPIEVP